MNDYNLNKKLILTSTNNSTMSKMTCTGSGGVGGGIGSGLSLPPMCAGCQKIINERYLLKAIDKLWHEDCLKCSCCDCRLGEVGSSLYIKANLILCRRDYLRLFGNTGICSACSKTIPAFEMVMRAKGHNYHLECFACQKCSQRFCVGDRFYLFENRILCEFDYEDIISRNGSSFSNSLEKLKKQTENIEYSTNSATSLSVCNR